MLQSSFLVPRPEWLLAAFSALARHGALTARQLAALAELQREAVMPVVEALVAEGLLRTLRPTIAVKADASEIAFTITRQGALLLAQATGRAVPCILNSKKSLYTLSHDLMRNELAVVLELLDRKKLLELRRFETARTRIGDSISTCRRGVLERVPLVADALAVVATNAGPSALLVEIDMGTVSFARMRQKYQGYDAWWKGDGPRRRFGLRSLRVLTLAPSQARLERLIRAALEATALQGSGLFWFAEHTAMDLEHPEHLFGPVWSVARPRVPSPRLPLFGSASLIETVAAESTSCGAP